MRWTGTCLGLILLALSSCRRPVDAPRLADDVTAEAFFSPTTVWTARLRLSREAWTDMQPTSSGDYRGRGIMNLQGRDGSRNGLSGSRGIEFDYVHADLELGGRRFQDVALRYKGNGTYLQGRATGKVSLKVDLNKYAKGQKLAGLSTINFHNDITDASWMNEVLAYRLYHDAGVPASRSSYARVYITVPGVHDDKYFGLYSIVENVDTNFIQSRFGTKLGAILKPSTRAPFTDLGGVWANYLQTYDPKTDLAEAEQRRVMAFCRFITSASDAEVDAHLADYLDLDEFARYAAVLVWLADPDSLLQIGQNYYVYLHPTSGKLQFIPWDLDHAFGQFGRGRAPNAPRSDTPIDRGWMNSNRFLTRVWSVEAFRTAYLKYVEEFSRTIFSPDRFATEMRDIAAAIRPAIEEESGPRLRAFDQIVDGTAGLQIFTHARSESVKKQLGLLMLDSRISDSGH